MKNKIKYYVYILGLIFLFSSQALIAQRHPKIENLPKFDLRPYHFGFTLCLNKMDFAIHPIPNFKSLDSVFVVQSTPQWGFNIGIVSNLRLNEYSDLRFIPTLSFGDRIINYTLQDSNKVVINDSKKVESTYLDFPFLIKFKSKRLKNARAYVIAGGQYSIDLASQAKKKDKKNSLVKIKEYDILYQVGVGFDFYLIYFKFATELKMSYGVNDLLKRDGTVYTKSINKLNSKIFQLSFLFE
ncbi:MAG: PorT family protein [Bacteroidetes bacterium]|nr:PorT family protein [Bacteroidota bacterium]